MKAKLIFPVFFLFLLVPAGLSAQVVPTQGHIMGYVIEDGDTLFVSSIPPLDVFSRDKRKKDKEWREYYQTDHNFAREYPYALQARERKDRAASKLKTHS